MTATKVAIPTATAIVKFNKLVCNAEGNTHHVLNMDRVESALHAAFYPGEPPFVHGVFADLVEGIASSKVSKEESITWFELHKKLLEEV